MNVRMQMWRHAPLAVAIVFGLLLPSKDSQASVMLPDLPAGSPYQILFETTDTIQGSDTGLSEYTDFVQNEASQSNINSLVGQNISWNAVVDTLNNPIITSNIPSVASGIPIYGTNGQLLFSSQLAFLGGASPSTIAMSDQFGNSTEFEQFWCGADNLSTSGWTAVFGGDYPTLLGNPSEFDNPPLGRNFYATTGEYDPSTHAMDVDEQYQTNQYSVLALSSPLTVPYPQTQPSPPTPEPSSILLFGIGIVGLLIVDRRRFQKDGSSK